MGCARPPSADGYEERVCEVGLAELGGSSALGTQTILSEYYSKFTCNVYDRFLARPTPIGLAIVNNFLP